MQVGLLTLANTNATSVWIGRATNFAVVPRYQEVNAEQAWFWTESWQAAEREVDEDLAQGRYEDFDTVDDFLASL